MCLLVPAALCDGQGMGVEQPSRDPFDVFQRPAAPETLRGTVERLQAELKVAEDALLASQTVAERHEILPRLNTSFKEIPSGALVVVTGNHSSGSGFMATIQGRIFLVTNIHVLGAAREAEFTTIDGHAIRLGAVAFVSRGRDIAIVPVDWDGPVLELSPSLRFDEVKIGQKVTVLGNSSGANVATRLNGEIRGIGPEELEVSAKFVPGNSGSPIVHDALGTVIAVASHLKDFSSDSKWTENTEFDEIRRFGYRLDGEIVWEQIELDDLFDQGEAYGRFEDRTRVMWNVSYRLMHESKLVTSYRDHESIGHLYDEISSDFDWGRGTASAHNAQMLKRFVNRMMSEVQSDISETDRIIKLGFYREQFDAIKNYRSQIRNNLDRFSESRL